MAIDDSQLTMDQILSGEPVKVPEAAPEPEPVEVAHEEQTEQVDTPAPEVAPEPETPEQVDADTAPREGEDKEPPPWIRDPDDANNWKALKGSAKGWKGEATAAKSERDVALAERDQIRAEFDAYRRRVEQEAQRAQRPSPQELPSVRDDPEAHIRAIREEIQRERIDRALDRSEIRAVEEYGRKRVEEAYKQLDTLPENDPLRVQMMTSDHPWGVMVQEIDRRALLNEIGTDPSTYKERIAAEVRAQVKAELAAEAKAEAEAGVEDSIRKRLPTSMANVASGAGQNSSTREDNWNGPAPMGEVIGGGLDRYS